MSAGGKRQGSGRKKRGLVRIWASTTSLLRDELLHECRMTGKTRGEVIEGWKNRGVSNDIPF